MSIITQQQRVQYPLPLGVMDLSVELRDILQIPIHLVGWDNYFHLFNGPAHHKLVQ